MSADCHSPEHGVVSDVESALFDFAPVALRLDDFSALADMFDRLRDQGVVSLRDYIERDRACLVTFARSVRTLAVNKSALALFGARDFSNVLANRGTVFPVERFDGVTELFCQLWEGQTETLTRTVMRSPTGETVTIQARARILPDGATRWSRVLMSLEDVTERVVARGRDITDDAPAMMLFEHLPVSLWLEDFSGVKHRMDAARAAGFTDFAGLIESDPRFVHDCAEAIHIIDVNKRTLELFHVTEKSVLMRSLAKVMGDQNKSFLRQLESLWHGELLYEDEGINYTIDGDEIHVHLQFSVCHGYEESWSLIQVALLDITARKKAEAELAFLGTHDVLTQLTNRSFYTYALERLERDEFYPVTLIIIDINGLKSANDSLGHEAGDELLRRAGQILSAAVEPPWHASRLGGDEFAIVMPGADEGDGAALIERIQAMVDEVNRSCSSLALSLSLASATRQPSERLNDVAGRADKLMYSAKRLFYRQRNNDRRLARH